MTRHETQDAAPGATAELVAFPDSTDRRLRRALRQLDAALAEQRAAIAEFRAQLGALSGAVATLGANAETLGGALAGAAVDAATAQRAARELSATAEMMERFAQP
jgi:septal ring factor EnvC (AmiA/AmiB activator)